MEAATELNELLELKRNLVNTGTILNFSGFLSQTIIEEFANAIKDHLDLLKEDKSAVHNVFSVFIEQTQNIKNYTATKNDPEVKTDILNSAIVSMGKKGDNYFVYSGNFVGSDAIVTLKEKIEKLQRMSKDEIKYYYKEQFRKAPPENSLGAGLGLIEMARKATEPIEYSFIKVSKRYYFYTLKVII